MFSSQSFATGEIKLKQQRNTFQHAIKALKTQQIPRYNELKQKLEGYPLQGYLEYLYLKNHLSTASNNSLSQFFEAQEDAFYSQRLRSSWLSKLAKQNRWQDFLVFYEPSSSASQQCLYLQALIATKQTKKAFELTPKMWLVGHSQDSACDPVFSAWQQAGLLTNQLITERMMLALRENQFSIASYLAKKTASAKHNIALVTRWQAMHQNPSAELNKVKEAQSPLAKEIIVHGLERLARRSPKASYQEWVRLKQRVNFDEQQTIQIRKTIGKWAALNRDDKALGYFGDIPGGEWQVRAALWQKDWKAAKRAIESMNIDERGELRWQYWLARSQAGLGQEKAANITFTNILGKRDYYSFLAADRLNKPYAMNHHPIPVTDAELEDLKKQPAIQRLHEFYMMDMMLEARREAYQLKQTRPTRELELIATLTHQWGWHHQTIALLGQAKYWDALDLRFPVIHSETVNSAGKHQAIDPSWLLAIARQESAFNPEARSHAGAMGLMQLMPNTGRLISKLIDKPLKNLSELYKPDRNIELGSAYLRKMYDDNQKNPVLATASYNAGPHRVKKWLPDQSLDADIWTENIPFNETRHYVQTVMSYAAIFDSQRGQPIKPISDRMPKVKASSEAR